MIRQRGVSWCSRGVSPHSSVHALDEFDKRGYRDSDPGIRPDLQPMLTPYCDVRSRTGEAACPLLLAKAGYPRLLVDKVIEARGGHPSYSALAVLPRLAIQLVDLEGKRIVTLQLAIRALAIASSHKTTAANRRRSNQRRARWPSPPSPLREAPS